MSVQPSCNDFTKRMQKLIRKTLLKISRQNMVKKNKLQVITSHVRLLENKNQYLKFVNQQFFYSPSKNQLNDKTFVARLGDTCARQNKHELGGLLRRSCKIISACFRIDIDAFRFASNSCICEIAKIIEQIYLDTSCNLKILKRWFPCFQLKVVPSLSQH